MDYAKESLRLHEEWKGKIEVVCNSSGCYKRMTCLWLIRRVWHSLVWRSEGCGEEL